MLENVTVIIPAHNRPERLRRLLGYYAGTGIHILVPDSSDKPYTGPIDPHTTVYLHRPRMHFLLKLREVLPLIDTPYVLYCADDDFAVPEGIACAAAFLDAHPDYATAQGHYLTFTPTARRIKFLPRYIRYFDSRVTADNPTGRLAQKSGQYASLLYAVARTDAFREIYSYCFGNDGAPVFRNLFLAEEYFNHAMLIEGKYATLPCFFSARERIAGSATSTTTPVADVRHTPEYEAYTAALAALLADKSGLRGADAGGVISRACDTAPDNPQIMFKRRINAILASHPLLRPLARLSEWRYARKVLRAVRGMESYPCNFSTPEKEAIIAAVRSTEK